VSLAQARQKAKDARELVRQGINPIDAAKAARSAAAAALAASQTFAQCAAAYVRAKSPEWSNAKHAWQWTASLATYADPVIGNLLVKDVDTPHVLRVLEPVWTTKTETATRLRGRIEAILDWAIARGYREGPNPARWKGHLSVMLPSPKKIAPAEHHAAMPFADVPAFMRKLEAVDAQGARALRFTILCASRSGEVRGARWSEIDDAARVWTIPAERMKARKEHRVPLSDHALQLLRELPRDGDLVLPAPRGGKLSDMTMTAVLRRLGVDAVPHGFRASFKTWASERANFPREVVEAALAHTLENKVEAAYQRGDLFDKRARLMQAWADYCVGGPAKVIAMKGRGR
jgi:integrase